jgi:transposase
MTEQTGRQNGDIEPLRILSSEDHGDHIEVMAEFVNDQAICPRCGAATQHVHDRRTQRKRDEASGRKPVFVVLKKRRFHCGSCGNIFTEPDPLCGSRRRTTQRLRAAIREAVVQGGVKRAAKVMNVSRVAVYRTLREVV